MNSTLWGVVIGGAIGLLSGLAVAGLNMLNDRLKWGREERVRYHSERLQHYARVLSLGDQLRELVAKHQADIGAAQDEFIDLFGAFTNAAEIVNLIATTPVRDAMDAYASRYIAYVAKVTDEGPLDDEDPTIDDLNKALWDFREVIRKERGLEAKNRSTSA